MTTPKGTLAFFCGKMGAGKSTKSKTLADEKNAVLISEDEWLASLYPDQINSFDDYIKFSTILKPLVKSHVQDILNTGTSVVMDFPANTVKQRNWFKQLCTEIECDHELIFLNVSDEQCLSNLAKRRTQQPERAQFDNEAMFKHVSKFFEAPSQDEGLKIVFLDGSS